MFSYLSSKIGPFYWIFDLHITLIIRIGLSLINVNFVILILRNLNRNIKDLGVRAKILFSY